MRAPRCSDDNLAATKARVLALTGANPRSVVRGELALRRTMFTPASVYVPDDGARNAYGLQLVGSRVPDLRQILVDLFRDKPADVVRLDDFR